MGTLALWIGFNAVVLAILALDLGVFHRHAHRVSLREAAIWSAVWVLLSLGFCAWIFYAHGQAKGLEFFTGYLIEKSLSVDNVFVFFLIFRAFAIEPRLQHRALFWGILGALLLRGAMIAVGTALVQRFTWIFFMFGAFLVITGVRLLLRGSPDFDPAGNIILRWARRVLPMAEGDTGDHFLVSQNGRGAVTSLFLALLVIEGADVLFAMDSIPAVFGITRDPFIVYTSNVCAILGLRAFYFLLVGMLPLFRYLDAGISAVLIFIGGKMLAEPWFHVSTPASLAVVAALLSVAVIASMIAGKPAGKAHAR